MTTENEVAVTAEGAAGTAAAVPEATTETANTANAAAAPKKENVLERIGNDIKSGVIDIGKFVGDLPKILKAWNTLSPEVKAILAQLFHDIFSQLVPAVTGDVEDIKTLNVAGAITLSEQTWTALQQLWKDAQSGEQEIVASLKVLGISV